MYRRDNLASDGAVPMKGVILAAGKGTRLYPVTKVIPKPLLPIANRATLEYAFDQMRQCGIREVCLVVGENESVMREALGDGRRYDLSLEYVRQTDPRGLAHAVGFAKDFVSGSDFLLYLGDAIYDRSLSPFVDQFRKSGAANLNLVKSVPDPRRFGVANVEDGRIVKLVEKPAEPESDLAMAGMYIFGPQIWDVLPDLKPSARGEFEITDAIQVLVDRGELVVPGIYEGEWFDTGTRESFLATSEFLVNGGEKIDGSAQVQAECHGMVVIGEGASLRARAVRDSVILPGAQIEVEGEIRGSILGGDIRSVGDVIDSVRYGDIE